MREISGHHSHKSRKRGFTLIEILIVIAIIALLGAILFPVFARVRENGRRTACASNLKQLGLAFMNYAQDHNGRLPGATDGGNASDDADGAAPNVGERREGGWIYYSEFGKPDIEPVFDVSRGGLYSYVRERGVYVCPSDGEGQKYGLSYAMNGCATQPDERNSTGVRQYTGIHGGRKLSSIRNPSQLMLVGEETRPGDGAAGEQPTQDLSTDDGFFNLMRAPDNIDNTNYFTIRHNSGGNVLFVDGHVKAFTIDQAVQARVQTGGSDLSQGCPNDTVGLPAPTPSPSPTP